MARFKQLSKMGLAIAEIIGEYTKEVDRAIEAGVPEAAETFREMAKTTCELLNVEDPIAAAKSPYGFYKDNWKIKEGTTSKYHKYVGNAKTVPDKRNGDIPLINILEYSTTRSHPHVNYAISLEKDIIFLIFLNKLMK